MSDMEPVYPTATAAQVTDDKLVKVVHPETGEWYMASLNQLADANSARYLALDIGDRVEGDVATFGPDGTVVSAPALDEADVNAMIVEGTGITKVFDAEAGTVTLSSTPGDVEVTSADITDFEEAVSDLVSTTIEPSPGITMEYDDETDTLSLGVDLTQFKLDDFAAPDDNTDLDASTSKHGLMKKFPGGTTAFLRADGSFAVPAGSTGSIDSDPVWDAKGDLAAGTGANAATRVPVGVDGQVLSADSTATGGVSWRGLTFNRKTGSAEYFAPDGAASATIGTTQSRLYFIPLRVNGNYTIDRIAVNVTTQAASSSTRCGLYSSSGGRPAGLLQDAGAATHDTTTLGDKEATVSWPVTPGLYWLAVVLQGGAPTVRAMNYPSDIASVIGSTTLSDLTGGTPSPIWIQNAVTGALPDPATPIFASGNVPRIIVRVT